MADITTYDVQAVRPGVVSVYFTATIGASGAPTLVAASSYGVTSIARTGAGLYTVVIRDAYNSILHYDLRLYADTPTEDINFVVDKNGSSSVTRNFLFATLTGATATDPSNGSSISGRIDFSNSTAL